MGLRFIIIELNFRFKCLESSTKDNWKTYLSIIVGTKCVNNIIDVEILFIVQKVFYDNTLKYRRCLSFSNILKF
jgi:hypothetical protein